MSATVSSSRRILVVFGLCVIAALVLMLWVRPLAGERDSTIPRIAAVEEIAATGESIRVAAANVSVSGRAESVAAAGANVRVDADVVENAWLAGAHVTVNGSVGNTIRAAGSRVALNARTVGSVWAAGADVAIGGEVSGDVRVAGGNVVIGPDVRIGGQLSAAGASVVIDGQTMSRVDVAGGLVMFNGQADGSLSVAADRLVLGPEAVVSGDLILLDATELEVQDGAAIAGATRRELSVVWWRPPQVDPRPGQFGFALFAAGTAILAGLGLMLVGRGGYEQAAAAIRNRPVTSGLIGLATLVLAPLAVGLIAITFVGLPIAIGLLLLIPLVLLLGYASAALGVADWIINRQGEERGQGRTILFLVAGAVGLALISLIPYLGILFILVALVIGAGAFLRTLASRLRQPSTPPPALGAGVASAHPHPSLGE